MEERRSSFLLLFFLGLHAVAVVLLSFPLVASSNINHGNYGGGGNSNYSISDRVALLSFKSFIISNDHGAFETWNINGDLCTSWRGVTCGRKHRRVVSLDLGSLNLTGTIPPSIANLTFLHQLDLSHNGLHGSIPGEFGSLSRLQHLNLSFNSLEGSIPASLSHCSQLRTISLWSNMLSGRIPSTLGSLSSLVQLWLGNNQLEAKDSGDWDFLAALSNCSKLQKLSLSDNQLGGALPSSVGNLSNTQLIYLGMAGNQISGNIPPSLSYLSALSKLYLYSNTLTGGIPLTIWQLPSLNVLSLWGNHLTGEIPPYLGNLSHSLTVLDLPDNNLTGSIPSTLWHLSSLSFLDLSDNHLTGEIPPLGNMSYNPISGNIPPSLGYLSALTELYLSNNTLTGSIPSNIWNLPSLSALSLWGNHLTGEIPPYLRNRSHTLTVLDLSINSLTGSIPSTIWHLSSLTDLILWGNQLTGEIPPLGNLSASSLTSLDLSHNSLTGSIPPSLGNLHSLVDLGLHFNNLVGAIPESLWNLSKLLKLDIQSNKMLTGALPLDLGYTLPDLSLISLSDNQFHGPIPTSLSNASSLEVIQLDGNLFSGTIPPSLGKLASLTRLTLSGNQLEAKTDTDWDFLASLSNCTSLQKLAMEDNKLGGKFPHSVYNLSSSTLELLFMSSNNISGSIAPGIGNLANLLALFLDGNLLTGTIPTTIGKLQKLHKLYLSNNRLTGEIPSAIKNLTQLNDLYLNNNYLTGHIPATLGECGQLRLLYLGNNNLTGAIPNRVVSISSLSNLVIGGNSLSGLLPTEVGSLINLVELDLSNNRLSGEIPSTIGACQELQRLHLQGNNFNGAIPSSFSVGLEVLDLSRNNLSGHIPESLANIRYLIMLNLSFNDLDGEVPKDGAFQNSTKVSLYGNKDLCGDNPELDLTPCSKQRKQRSSSITIILSAIGASLCLVALVFCLVFACWHKRRSKNKHGSSNIQRPMKDKHIRISYNELFKATNGFSSANLIGQGSFGSVYKGTMSYYSNHNDNVAVKVLNLQQQGASKSFMAECEALRNIRHRNLLKILTSCSSIDLQGNDFKALVFEYLPNESLEKWLHCKQNDERIQEKLSLTQRLNIAIDIASALDYLHNRGDMPIIHCDLKPSNVLLDNDMTAHVGDFGLARFLSEDAARSSQRSTSSIILKGSIGYIAPEYGIGNQVSTQGDLYSYGIVILEMFTGRGPTDDAFKEGLNLRRFVEMAFSQQLMEIIDPYLLTDADVDILPQGTGIRNKNLECISKVLQIGLSCSNESPMDRMHIEDVIKKMEDIRDVYNRNGAQGYSTNQI